MDHYNYPHFSVCFAQLLVGNIIVCSSKLKRGEIGGIKGKKPEKLIESKNSFCNINISPKSFQKSILFSSSLLAYHYPQMILSSNKKKTMSKCMRIVLPFILEKAAAYGQVLLPPSILRTLQPMSKAQPPYILNKAGSYIPSGYQWP